MCESVSCVPFGMGAGYGSETEKVIKINEKLSAKGKDLDSVSRAEFEDIAHDVGLKRHAPQLN